MHWCECVKNYVTNLQKKTVFYAIMSSRYDDDDFSFSIVNRCRLAIFNVYFFNISLSTKKNLNVSLISVIWSYTQIMFYIHVFNIYFTTFFFFSTNERNDDLSTTRHARLKKVFCLSKTFEIWRRRTSVL